jgi:peptidoglycan/LPS O-acetylase OafA/YrhL
MIETFFSLLILLSILLISVFIANQIKPIPVSQVKYTSIEGLRGYLAFFVFIHHSYIWFSYIKTNTWEAPQSNLFNSFGQSSVLFFFMITSFLFTTKILESTPTINWKKLFISRFFRLVPMYFFSMVLFMIIVIIKSNGTINDSISSIIKNVITWFAFTISGNPNINNVKDTYLINAGVAWSLPYEWIFYFMLPLLGILFKVKTSIKTIIISTAIVILFIVLNKSRLNYFFPFLSGILIAIFAKKLKIQVF